MRLVSVWLIFFLFLNVMLPLYGLNPVHALPELKVKNCLETNSENAPSPQSSRRSLGGIMLSPPSPMQVMTTYQPESGNSLEAGPSFLNSKQKQKTAKSGKWDVHQAAKQANKKLQNANEIYLSNDDSMSLASAQRIIYAIENFLPIYRSEIRPHEFLNYYHFQTDPVPGGETFSVNFQMAPSVSSEKTSNYLGQTLAIGVQGKRVTKESRKLAVMTFILDRSGSMGEQGKMEFLKSGLETLKTQLKEGDVLNVVEFDHGSCTALEGFVVGRDTWTSYDKTVAELTPSGSTDLHLGLTQGYQLANKFYDSAKLNRVILVTDAIANTGELSSKLMANITKYYDEKKIALSGIGVGLDFNDELLDTLTEAGRGAYLFLGIREAIPRVFGSDFVSLLQSVARDVHFKLGLPEDLRIGSFYGEEASEDVSKVQAIHYFANSSQLFLLDLRGQVKNLSEAKLNFTIDYENADSGQKSEENLNRSLAQIQQGGQNNVIKARLIMVFADLLQKTALSGARPLNDWAPRQTKLLSFDRADGKKYCGEAFEKMQVLEKSYSDEETSQVRELAKKYCARF